MGEEVRDPRVDPRPGDVLAKRKFVKVVKVLPPKDSTRIVLTVRTFEWSRSEPEVPTGYTNYGYTINDWKRWAAKARVVRMAEEMRNVQ